MINFTNEELELIRYALVFLIVNDHWRDNAKTILKKIDEEIYERQFD